MSAGREDRGRAAAVDGLRALAALSVLGYHAWLYTRDRVSAGVRGSLADELAHELRLGLVLFFVLSGYLLYRPWVRSVLSGAAPPRAGAYLVRRAARIVPAYYAAVLGSVALLWSLDATPGVRLPPAEDLWLFAVFGQNFHVDTLLSLNAPLWTLAVEWSFYLVLPVLGWLALRLRGASREAQAIVPAVFLAAGAAWNWSIAGEEVPPTLTKVLPAMAPYFAVGMLAALLAHGRTLGRRAAWALLAAGLVLVATDAWWAALAARERIARPHPARPARPRRRRRLRRDPARGHGRPRPAGAGCPAAGRRRRVVLRRLPVARAAAALAARQRPAAGLGPAGLPGRRSHCRWRSPPRAGACSSARHRSWARRATARPAGRAGLVRA